MEKGNVERPGSVPHTMLGVAALFLLAIVVRLATLGMHPGAPIEMDGAEYARIAENVRTGHGLIGIRGYSQQVFPPLYSLLIAGVSLASPSYEVAGVALSLVLGASIVFPLFGIASLLYGRRAGLIAAALGATVPFSAELSTQVISEPLFVTLSFTAIYALLLALRRPMRRYAVASGGAFAAAYLTRPEGGLFAVIALAASLAMLVVSRERGVRVAQIAAFVAAFLLCISPYIAYQYKRTGHFSVEGKSGVNYALGQRLGMGMSYPRAANEVHDDLTEVGVEIAPPGAQFALPTLGQRLVFAVGATHAHFGAMLRVLISRACGGLPLFGLAVWGLVVGPWNRERAFAEGVALSMVIGNVAALATVWHFWPRYDAFFIPFLLFWSAHGMLDLSRRFCAARGVNAGTIAAALTALIFLSSYVTMARQNIPRGERDAGGWIVEHEGSARGKTVMETTDLVSYYSGGMWRPLPYASAQTALRYITRVHPDYIALSATDQSARPYLSAWLSTGIPLPAYVRALDLHPGGPEEVAIYRAK